MRVRRFVTLIFLTIALSACGDSWKAEESSTSPDGKLQAVVEYKDAPACCSDHSRLSLKQLTGDTLRNSPGTIVEASRTKLRVHWESDESLLVEACNPGSYSVSATHVPLAGYTANGQSRSVAVTLITAPTVRGGKRYCSDSAGK